MTESKKHVEISIKKYLEKAAQSYCSNLDEYYRMISEKKYCIDQELEKLEFLKNNLKDQFKIYLKMTVENTLHNILFETKIKEILEEIS